jgi:hypothetical protein
MSSWSEETSLESTSPHVRQMARPCGLPISPISLVRNICPHAFAALARIASQHAPPDSTHTAFAVDKLTIAPILIRLIPFDSCSARTHHTMSHTCHSPTLDRAEAAATVAAIETCTGHSCPYSNSGPCAFSGAPGHGVLEQISPSNGPVVVPQGTFVHASGPARIDLAGGWTDTIPIT